MHASIDAPPIKWNFIDENTYHFNHFSSGLIWLLIQHPANLQQ